MKSAEKRKGRNGWPTKGSEFCLKPNEDMVA